LQSSIRKALLQVMKILPSYTSGSSGTVDLLDTKFDISISDYETSTGHLARKVHFSTEIPINWTGKLPEDPESFSITISLGNELYRDGAIIISMLPEDDSEKLEFGEEPLPLVWCFSKSGRLMSHPSDEKMNMHTEKIAKIFKSLELIANHDPEKVRFHGF